MTAQSPAHWCRDLILGRNANDPQLQFPPDTSGNRGNHRCVLVALTDHLRRDPSHPIVWPSIETLAEITQLHRTTVGKSLEVLEGLGLIEASGVWVAGAVRPFDPGTSRSRGRAPVVWWLHLPQLEALAQLADPSRVEPARVPRVEVAQPAVHEPQPADLVPPTRGPGSTNPRQFRGQPQEPHLEPPQPHSGQVRDNNDDLAIFKRELARRWPDLTEQPFDGAKMPKDPAQKVLELVASGWGPTELAAAVVARAESDDFKGFDHPVGLLRAVLRDLPATPPRRDTQRRTSQVGDFAIKPDFTAARALLEGGSRH